MPNEVEQRLREIEERVSKASPPPWFYHPMRGAVYSKGTPILALVEDVNPAFKTEFADLMFVENARDDVPWLLSLLREREEQARQRGVQMERYLDALVEIRDYAWDRVDLSPDATHMLELADAALRGEQL